MTALESAPDCAGSSVSIGSAPPAAAAAPPAGTPMCGCSAARLLFRTARRRPAALVRQTFARPSGTDAQAGVPVRPRRVALLHQARYDAARRLMLVQRVRQLLARL